MTDYVKEIELLLSIDENTQQTVQNIEQAKKELQTTINSITDLILLLDEEGKIVRCNRALSYWNLEKQSQPEGILFHDLFHPTCSDAKCHMRTYWALAKIKLLRNESFEYQLLDDILGRYLLIQFRPISIFPQEQQTYLNHFAVATIKDITKNRQAEIQLDQTTEELRSIFMALPDQYIRLNWDGTILNVRMSQKSDAAILSSGAIGKKFFAFFPPTTAEKFRDAIYRALRTENLEMVEYSLFTGGSEQFFEARLLPQQQNNIIVINRNITEKKRLESIAESIDLMKSLGYIFSGIRHELGNPINAIKMTMSVLQTHIGLFSNEKIMEYIDRVMSEINRVEYLLKSFKNFNMFETLSIITITVEDYLKQFVALVDADFKEKGITIHLEVQPVARLLRADPRALHQVLLNIISNAVDALSNRPDPEIKISAIKLFRKIEVTISDNGRGINEIEMKNIFKPFYTTKSEGSGLGLVIVRKILTRMDGEIKIESTENKGTTVTIILPGVI